MRLDEIVAWYQKKIGTYDKQQWERTVEQKILDGLSGVTLKTAKLKTELIDVDLVRGSTFPKAKSKQSLLTVLRLAILRYLFLPVYTKWWVTQTSPNIFGLLLCLYVTQMINWAVYTFNVNRLGHNESTAAQENVKEHIVSLSELLIPMGLSFLLSLIHSQIVATNTQSGCKSKCRRFSNTSQSGKQQRTGEAKLRRRKKFVKVRCQDSADAATAQRKTPSSNKKFHSGMEVIAKIYKNVPCESNSATEGAIDQSFNSTSSVLRKSHNSHVLHPPPPSSPNKARHFDLNYSTVPTVMATSADFTTDNHKKRNVNWHFPIHNYATELESQTQKMKEHQPNSPQSSSTTETSSELNSQKSAAEGVISITTANSSGHVPVLLASNAGSTSAASPKNIVRIDECVQEFYNDLINRTAADEEAVGETVERHGVLPPRRSVGDDDGFESLNGKSSSGEETINSRLSTIPGGQTLKNQLRLRLNVTHLEGQSTSQSAVGYRRKVPLSSESEDNNRPKRPAPTPSCCDAYPYQQTIPKSKTCASGASSGVTEEEGDDGEVISSPASVANNSNYNECTTSATEWLGVTTNSEECSYSSELENSDNYKNAQISDEDGYDADFTPTTILNPYGTNDRISCTFWDQREIKKAQMSVLEISSCIIDRVESMPETKDYIYIGVCFSILLSLIPPFCRLCEATIVDSDKSSEISFFDVPMLLWEKASFSFSTISHMAFGKAQWERTVLVIGFVQRLCLTTILFIIFAVAERTFKQRFLYAKLFSHLTSSRRARKSNLPHFRLNKVRNIKTWLSVRSYLKKRGPQRSVEVIVSAAFIVTLLLLAFLSVEWLKDSVRLHTHLNLEALLWSTTIGIFLLRFMTLGNKIHEKYRSVSVLITEQINLYLQIEQKPKKKDDLMVSNSVLKLAADLLKELETPFKISGLSANPYLFTTIKVVILSALSGVLSEMLGFKLKLHKIKIK